MAEEGVVAAVSPVPLDHKRKLEDLEPEVSEQGVSDPPPAEALADSNVNLNSESDLNEAQNDALKPQEIDEPVSGSPEAKRPRLEEEENDGSAIENGHQEQPLDEQPMENVEPLAGSILTESAEERQSVVEFQTENHENHSNENHEADNAPPSLDENLLMNAQHPSGADLQQTAAGIPQPTDFPSAQEQPTTEMQTLSRKMEVPNNKEKIVEIIVVELCHSSGSLLVLGSCQLGG